MLVGVIDPKLNYTHRKALGLLIKNSKAIDKPVFNRRNFKGEPHGTIYPTPPLGQDMTQGQFLSGV